MISHIEGKVESTEPGAVVIDAGGIGYEIFVPSLVYDKLSHNSAIVKLYTVEAFSMYAGGSSLYGFLNKSDKDLFNMLKEEVPGAGAKKALEYFDKVAKAPDDFKRIVAAKDIDALIATFGFTKKTAEKIIAALKDKISALPVAGGLKHERMPASAYQEAIAGLVVLGYKQLQASTAVDKAMIENPGAKSAQEIIKLSLRYL